MAGSVQDPPLFPRAFKQPPASDCAVPTRPGTRMVGYSPFVTHIIVGSSPEISGVVHPCLCFLAI